MRFNIYFEDSKLNKKSLFLNELNRNKETLYEDDSEFMIFRQIYTWFIEYLDINFDC